MSSEGCEVHAVLQEAQRLLLLLLFPLQHLLHATERKRSVTRLA